MEYEYTISVAVHDPAAVIGAGSALAEAEGCGDQVNTVEAALVWLFDPGVTPLDNGFEVINSSARAVPADG